MGKRMGLLIFCWIVLAGCGSGGGITNQIVNPDAGTWNGTWVYQESGVTKDQGTAVVTLTQVPANPNLVVNCQLTSTSTSQTTQITMTSLADDWIVTLPGQLPIEYMASGFDFHAGVSFHDASGQPRRLDVVAPMYHTSADKYAIQATKVP